MKHILFALCLPFAAAGAAEFPDLPLSEQAEQALRAHPRVAAAAAALRASAASADGLVAGNHEVAVRVRQQQREDRVARTEFREYELGLERTFRLPRKAELDAQLAATLTSKAEYALGDALHETGVELLALWFDWWQAGAAAAEWQTQVTIADAQLAGVRKKIAVGESAAMESLMAEAHLTQMQAELDKAIAQQERATLLLQQHFPAVVLPPITAVLPPDEPDADLAVQDSWRQRMLAENHELAAQRTEARLRQIEASRIDAERRPDPTVGFSVGRERDGQEQLWGVHLSIPLPGAARTAHARAAAANADVAAARAALAASDAEARARQTISAALHAFRFWQRAADIARRMEENTRLVERAWQLGEESFSALQAARRLSIEARLAATQAALEARHARYRMQLDAHALWRFD